MGIVAVLTGVFFFLIGLYLIFQRFLDHNGVRVIGEIVGYANYKFHKPIDGSESACRTVARFVGFDGRPRLVIGTVGTPHPTNKVGDKVRIILKREDVNFAKLEEKSLLVLGILFVLIGGGCAYGFSQTVTFDPFSILVALFILGSLGHTIFKIKNAKKNFPNTTSETPEKNVYFLEDKNQINWVDLKTNRKVREPVGAGVKYAFTFLFLITLGLTLWAFKSTYEFIRTATATQGKVIDLVSSTSRRDGKSVTTYAPKVEFQVSGQSFQFKHKVSSSNAMYSVNEIVTVLYNPDDPSDARIDMGIWNYFLTYIAGFCALVFGAVLFLIMKSDRKVPNQMRRAV